MTLPGHHDAVTCLQFDDRRIVSGSLDCNLKFWDVHTGACSNTIDWKASEGHTGVVRCVEGCGRGREGAYFGTVQIVKDSLHVTRAIYR